MQVPGSDAASSVYRWITITFTSLPIVTALVGLLSKLWTLLVKACGLVCRSNW